MLSKQEKAEIIKTYGKNAKDTGTSQVQIALLTARIKQLTEHLKANKNIKKSDTMYRFIFTF